MGSRAHMKLRGSNARQEALKSILPARDISELSPEERKAHAERQAANGNVGKDPRTVECPKCDALVGEPCWTPAGYEAKSYHKARLA